MSINALHTAATGLSAMSTSIDVTANNLANVNTTGFKSSRVNFEDLLYTDHAQPGVENANGDERPAGIQVGMGVKVANTDRNFAQGAPVPTDNPLDLMIQGDGFFQVDITDDISTGIGYTRAGNFFRNSDGDLVLGSEDGPRLIPAINIPIEAQSVEISSDGRVQYFTAGSSDPTEAGQITLANFINTKGLMSIGNNLLVESAASGPAIEGVAKTEGFGSMLSGSLEGSNVNPVVELVALIKTQRAFEMNSQSIQAADQALQVLNNLKRF